MPDGKCIAPSHVLFDSIANDPRLGNEAYFMRAKVMGSPGSMQSRVKVRVGDTILIHALIVNDAAMNAAGRRLLVAHGTRFSLRIPMNSSSELPIIGVISAPNATPQHVDDGVFLSSKKRFSIEYDWGSAVLATRRHKELPLSDDIVGEGALVGSGRPNGTSRQACLTTPSCFFWSISSLQLSEWLGVGATPGPDHFYPSSIT
jgi:hypothetical protein